jgi:hypothetical protein
MEFTPALSLFEEDERSARMRFEAERDRLGHPEGEPTETHKHLHELEQAWHEALERLHLERSRHEPEQDRP